MIPAVPLLALAFTGGIAVAAAFGGPWWFTSIVAAALAVALSLFDPARTSRAVLVAAVAIATIGQASFAAAAAADPTPLAAIASAASGSHEVIGTAVTDARLRGALASVDIDVEQVNGVASAGRLRMTVRVETAGPRADDRIRATGDLQRAPRAASNDYVEYLRSAGIDAVLAYPPRWAVVESNTGAAPVRALRALRRWATSNIERSLPEPAASLVAGVLLGEQRTMPAALTDALRATGTTHLVGVSGQNVAMLTGALVALLAAWLPRRRAALLALALIPAYVLLVGAEPPVVRAALMAVGITVGAVTGRRTPAWIFLVYACAGMLAFNPMLARSVSFQLSAAATAGVLILSPLLAERAAALLAGRGALLASLAEASAVATGAAIAVIPVQAAAFGTLSLLQVPANAVIAPLYGATTVVAIMAGLLGWFPPVATALHASGQFVPAAFIGLVELLARMPGATIAVHAPALAWIGWYLLVGGLVWALSQRESDALGGAGGGLPTIRLALAVVAIGLWMLALTPREHSPSVTILDVGQGLAILVRDGDAAVLIDAGPPDGAVLAALARAGQSRPLDAVVITHADADHAGGLAAVRSRIGATRTLAPDGVSPGAERIDIGDRIRLGPQTTIEALWPPVTTLPYALASENDRALVLLVTIGTRRILLPADIEAPAEHWLARSGQDLRADVIVVGHHGSKSSSTPELLAAVEPRAAVISVGARNSYGHPNAEVVARYAAMPLYRTDEVGEVTVRSDGVRLWVQAAHATLPAQRNGGTR